MESQAVMKEMGRMGLPRPIPPIRLLRPINDIPSIDIGLKGSPCPWNDRSGNSVGLFPFFLVLHLSLFLQG